MEAAVFGGPGTLLVQQRPVPAVQAGDDVIVAVEACGVCGSDLQMLAVPPAHPCEVGIVLGHEISGRVAAHGPDVTAPSGLVVVDPDIKCGTCASCRRGRPSICERMVALGVNADGGFAAYCRVPARNVYSIDDHVPPTLAALVEPLAAVLNGVERARPRLGECAAIFGAGAIGGMFLKALQASGIERIWMVDPVASRRERAERLGASGATSSLEELIDGIRSGLAPAPDLVVDAVGTCLGDAIRVVADGGRVLLFGINEAAELPIRQFEITSRELSIIGALTSRFTFPAAIAMIESGTFTLDDIRPHEIRVDQLDEALDLLRLGTVFKAMVRPGLDRDR
jgi:threonine dehydrogenase-like Zn-dependent dehydrogenase